MIADFHNDYITCSDFKTILNQYLRTNSKIIGAIFRGGKDYIFAKTLLTNFLKNKSDDLFFAFEDFSYEEDLPNLIYGLLDFKPVYVGLTWNYENNLAFGCNTDGPLKKRGIYIIKELKKRNIYLDVAHLSETSFYSALKYTDKILCSHCCFYDIQPHRRNLKMEQIQKIIEFNGLIGLTFYTPFLTDKQSANVEDIFRHIDYFASKFSVKNLAIGTDFYGCSEFPSGFSDYSFKTVLTECLIKHGYKSDDIKSILYGNLSKMLSEK